MFTLVLGGNGLIYVQKHVLQMVIECSVGDAPAAVARENGKCVKVVPR
jgi:hypothetical protein